MQPDILDDAKLSATDVIKSALKGVIQKTAEATREWLDRYKNC